jgi:hypothetical protein
LAFIDYLRKETMNEDVRKEPKLERTVAATGSSEDGTATTKGTGKEEPRFRRRIIHQNHEVEPLDLGEASREAILKRVAPVIVGIGMLGIIIWILRNRT